MVDCLRGLNLPLEKSLDVIADCANRELPGHLITLPPTRRDPAHYVVIPAFVNNEARLYTLELAVERGSSESHLRCHRHQKGKNNRVPESRSPAAEARPS
jgi:hypothetical protein